MKKEKICQNCKHSYESELSKAVECLHCKFDGEDTLYMRYHECHYPDKFELLGAQSNNSQTNK